MSTIGISVIISTIVFHQVYTFKVRTALTTYAFKGAGRKFSRKGGGLTEKIPKIALFSFFQGQGATE